MYTYTVGPVLAARLPVVQPFVHALFGGITASAEALVPVLPCWWEEVLMLACEKALVSVLCKRIG